MGKKKKNGQYFDQASAVPYRFRDGELEFCVITTSNKRHWGLPKGIIDEGETPSETAVKEAEEEAGLHGTVTSPPLGQYKFQKWGRALRVVVFLMHVDEVWDHWEEIDQRERRWVDPAEATDLLQRRGLWKFIHQAAERLEVPVGYE